MSPRPPLVAWLAYSRWAITSRQRAVLTALRFVTLLTLVVFLLRPVVEVPGKDASQAVVPILVDTSRSMSIEDAARGGRRIDRARQLLAEGILPALGSRFQIEVLGFGESVGRTVPQDLSASARKSDLGAALTTVRDRYRGRVVAGVVLVSDGGDTSGGAERAAEGSAPIFPLGIGAIVPGKDREVLSVTAAEQVLDDSRVDLAVSAVSHGLGVQPIELRLLENGRPIDVRRAIPAGEGVPVREVFQVSPARGAPAVYTVEIPAAAGELVPENNARGVLVQPPVRPRRVLLVEGAPGFEHSFLKRAWAGDPGLEVDSVVRKGRNEQGADTFYIQAVRPRGDSLTSGFPPTRETLFLYDAIVLANVEGHQFTAAQLESARAFVGARGGGLLVLGARSFLRQGLAGSALEEVVPLDLTERGGGAVPASGTRGTNRIAMTPAGESPSGHAARAAPRGHAEALGSRAAARLDGAAWGAATWRQRAGRDERAGRRAAGARGRPALRRRTLDGVRGRGLVAVADAAAGDRSHVRNVLEAGGALAGARRGRPDADRRGTGRAPRARRSRCASSCATPRSSRSGTRRSR